MNASIDNGTTTQTWDGEQPFHRALFETLESAANVAVTEIEPVYETIDVESLERFITNSSSNDIFTAFSYGGCYVEIQGDGTITVTPFRQIDPK
ncbi:HalOD1 output domain-containing protein [Halorientalis brevis]|uniref:HalOD1 output domain-containing protein n=1 Tax=Halorientalis brevis TaxID=1126241 RepID=A0ABD6CGU1_9EURY|nr:HalOD1 output domain-containing protein [Halorientalis brevis]